MARGNSGRIVIEVDPQTKSDLYRAQAQEGISMKDWFLQTANAYISDAEQPLLFNAALKTAKDSHE